MALAGGHRLRYANAAIPEALIAAGSLLGDNGVLADGLRLLEWLFDIETTNGSLSVTPAGGWAPPTLRPAFDQQPIEVAALADACVRAFEVTGDPRWAAALDLAVGWFLGNNDCRLPIYDAATGGGFDALTVTESMPTRAPSRPWRWCHPAARSPPRHRCRADDADP